MIYHLYPREKLKLLQHNWFLKANLRYFLPGIYKHYLLIHIYEVRRSEPIGEHESKKGQIFETKLLSLCKKIKP